VYQFLPAWSLRDSTQARHTALSSVAVPQLVDELAAVDPARLPHVIGDPTVKQATPARVVVDVRTTDGVAVLTVQPTAAGWRVTAVSLTSGAAATSSGAPTPGATA